MGLITKGMGAIIKGSSKKTPKKYIDQVTGKSFSKKTIKHMKAWKKSQAETKAKGYDITYLPVRHLDKKSKKKGPIILMEVHTKGKK
jgi:hypothetical protein